MVFCVKCGTGTYYRAAMAVAIIDIVYTAVILILFVLGTSLMAGFEFSGNQKNATKVLDELTDEVFGTDEVMQKHPKNVAEDMGVFLIVMFLSTVDFIISCIFLDGVKTKNAFKCQAWFNIRLVILVIFDIVVFINVMYGSSWYRCIPDAILTVYRLLGILIGYAFLQELHTENSLPPCIQCQPCHCSNICSQRNSVINLSGRRKELEKALQDMPIVMVTGPDEPINVGITSSPQSSVGTVSPQVTITRKSSTNSNSSAGKGLQNATTLFPES